MFVKEFVYYMVGSNKSLMSGRWEVRAMDSTLTEVAPFFFSMRAHSVTVVAVVTMSSISSIFFPFISLGSRT